MGKISNRVAEGQRERLMNGSCATCKFYAALAQQCRRHSPVVLLVGIHPDRGPMVNGYHPPVTADHWCGEYEVDLTVAPDSALRASRQSM
jgi:hypothetical protein